MISNGMNEQNNTPVLAYASKIMELARDTITVRFRFFDTALGRIRLEARMGLGGFMVEGDVLYYDPMFLLKKYVEEPSIAVRLYLHILMHQIFLHPYREDKNNHAYWDMATDIAVENIILELNISSAAMGRDDEQKVVLARIAKWCPEITADKLYREFLINGISKASESDYRRLFSMDLHNAWKGRQSAIEEIMITEEEWRKISERIKADLKTFSKNKTGSESLDSNIEEATKTRYDYSSILRRFAVMGEEIMISEDEFDYIYYTYGLSNYDNMPLIEPLEYVETNKVREFVIALDTSASCRGSVVKNFLKKTYDILKSSDNFFHNVNVHIVMCDAEIQQDIKITDDSEFMDFIASGKLTGFGATDFRPVFSYVDQLIEQKEFENLKGLIYFTDGYGIYPEHMPSYDVIFAFLDEDKNRLAVPPWAIQVILEAESLDD